MAFHVGQRVVCVDADPRDGKPSPGLKKNGIYTITDIVETFFGAGVKVAETTATYGHPWKGREASRFRPLVERKTDISIFTAMLTPNKQGVDA